MLNDRHNYIAKLQRMLDRRELPLGRAVEVDVRHEDGCAFLLNPLTERCNCDPEIRLVPKGKGILQ